VAKRRSDRYVPGEGGWIKTKNRDYWRYELEREGCAEGDSFPSTRLSVRPSLHVGGVVRAVSIM
jgi:hypothetical protein